MNEPKSKVMVGFLLGALILAILTVTGCQTPQPLKTQAALPENPLDITNKCGISLRDAQAKSLDLAVGMTQDQVASLLCKPDETSVETFGIQTSKPWNGFEWIYRWGKSRFWPLRERNPHNTLTIIFEKRLDNNWVVNTWIWSGPF